MPTSTIHGLLVVDKPAGISSRQAVDRAQRWLPRGTRLGHTGTLDPLATGVLVLTVGRATRLGEYVQCLPKTYHTILQLGARSSTDDAAGVIVPTMNAVPPERSAVERILREFVGEIDQVPPAYSAAKVNGQRAYDLARHGADVVLQARRVRIDRIDLLTYTYPRLELQIDCGKGTYIRSLARDLGERLGCGGYVQMLRRLRVGPFSVQEALSLDVDREIARQRLLPPEAALVGMPRITMDRSNLALLQRGGILPLGAPSLHNISLPGEGELAVFDVRGHLVLLAEVDPQRRVLRPVKVLVPG